MSSKQEKLAAARKKLKEFQGRHKPSNGLNGNSPGSTQVQLPGAGPKSDSSNASTCSTPVFQENNYHSQSAAKFFDKGSPFLQDVAFPSNTGGTNILQQFQNKTTLNDHSQYHHQDVNTDCQGQTAPFAGNASPIKYANERSTPNSDVGPTEVLQPLQQQLQNHVQTIAILVSERNELQQAFSQAQLQIHNKTGEVETLKQRIHLSETQAQNFKTNLIKCEEALHALQVERQHLLTQSEAVKLEECSARNICEEMSEKFEAKSKECQNLKQNIQNLQGELSMVNIKLEQLNLSDSNSVGPQLYQLQSENKRLVQRSQELEKQFQQAISDKEQSSQNFHVYAQQCNTQISSLKKQMDLLISENETLVQKNDALNRVIQEKDSERQGESPSHQYKEEICQLLKMSEELTETNKQWEQDYSSKTEEVAGLKLELQEREAELKGCIKMLEEVRADNTRLLGEVEKRDGSERLLAAMESDKVAASRAVSQNVKLKQQLLELEQGFIKVSDEKLDLTEKLEHERFVNKELTQRLEELEDRARNQKQHGHIHQHKQHSHADECCDDHDHAHAGGDNEEREEDVEQLQGIILQLQEDKAELLSRLNIFRDGKQNDKQNEEEVEESDREVVRQMEEKVRRTMNEIAVLDEEKQKLEHLVMQLQGETETIGEYISLYQKQRLLLRQRTKEKDDQLIQLSQDREELKEKLAALDNLVQSLLGDKEEAVQEEGEEAEEADDTADKIRALITEIGSTNLVLPHPVSFEHCPCCSGRLINI